MERRQHGLRGVGSLQAKMAPRLQQRTSDSTLVCSHATRFYYVAELRSYATHDPVIVRYLLDQGANPNLGPQRGPGIGVSTAFRQVANSGATLESAARYGNVETFDLLLAHDAVLSNAAPMHAAAGEQNIEIMAHLLELGVDLDERESMTLGRPSYGSPLLRAMFSGKPQAVRFLLDHGASTLSAVPAAMDLSNTDRIQGEIRKMVIEVGER
jgi:ankyrin repeat protein